MRPDYDVIKTLLLKEISGDITALEAVMLKQALEHDAEARELASQIRDKVDVKDVYNYFVTNDKQHFTEEVVGKIHRRKRKKVLLQYICVSAAASLIIFAGIWYFLSNRASDVRSTVLASAIGPDSIILSLPDGKRLSLDSTDQQLQHGNITINTNNNTISYSTNGEGTTPVYATLNVPEGKDYKIRLKDGSEIHLNAATKLRFPLSFKDNNREVTISGEAYIKVALDAQKPFMVHLPHGTVEVLGTEFNVNTYDSTIQRISLVTGSVRVRAATGIVVLKPGKEAATTSHNISITAFDVDEVLAWRQGMYYIDNATLTELSAVLNRWYGCKVVVDSKEAAVQRFTGVLYRSQPVELMLKGLQLTNTIRYFKDESGVIHIK